MTYRDTFVLFCSVLYLHLMNTRHDQDKNYFDLH